MKRQDDRNDDPEVPKDSEPPRASVAATLGMKANVEGESSQPVGTSDKGKQPIEAFEPIEALIGLDDSEDDLSENSESEPEAPIIDDVLEDGEIPPEEFVVDCDISMPEVESSETITESDEELDHVVLKARMTKHVRVDETSKNVEDLSGLKEQVNAENLKQTWKQIKLGKSLGLCGSRRFLLLQCL